jgi:hypothetical protein
MITTRIHMAATRKLPGMSRTMAFSAALAALAVAGCSKADNSSASASDSAAAAAAAPAPAAASTGAPTSNTVRLRGNVVAISDTALDLSSDSGNVHVSIGGPLDVYTRAPATLAQVSDNSFVGVTSVKQPDGSQRATEIHIFPDKLRGTGEGSYLMQRGNRGGGGAPSTMTNGTVSGAPADSSKAPRMTNGSVAGKPGATMTVKYDGGTQTITIPPDVNVSAIAPSTAPLAAGANVSVTATRQSDGTLKASFVMLGGGRGGPGRGGRRERPQ